MGQPKFKVGDRIASDRCPEHATVLRVLTDNQIEIKWDDDRPAEVWESDDFYLVSDSAEWIQSAIDRTNRLDRIERWAGMAMQGNCDLPVSDEELAKDAFDLAEAMEAEYQRRYFNNNQSEKDQQ